MKRLLLIFTLVFASAFLVQPAFSRGSNRSKRTEHVNGYRRKDGKYVKPYYRAPAGQGSSHKSGRHYGKKSKTKYHPMPNAKPSQSHVDGKENPQ